MKVDRRWAMEKPSGYWLEKRLETGTCPQCDGCGWIATDDDLSPAWQWWALPIQSQLAATLGLIQFIECDECLGTGAIPSLLELASIEATHPMRAEDV